MPRKPCSAGKDSWLNAQVRTGPRRICRGNHGPCQVFGLMLGFAAPRRFCREHRAPCWFLGKMLRSAGSRFRSTGAPKMPGNSSNQGHYTPPAVVKCKFPLSELRGEATYYTHRAVAGSRFPSTKPLHLKSHSNIDFIHVPCSYTPHFCCFPRQNGCSSPIQR